MARRFVPGLFHLDMSIPLLPLIKPSLAKPQVLEVGHTTDTRRRITLLSSTLKVAKVSNIHATLTYIRKFTHTFGNAGRSSNKGRGHAPNEAGHPTPLTFLFPSVVSTHGGDRDNMVPMVDRCCQYLPR